MKTLKEILDKHEYSGDIDQLLNDKDAFYDLFVFFLPEMPYGTAKARDGDPYLWIADRILELDELLDI